jgi:hypothetical protein
MAPGTDDFPEPWRDDPGRSEARRHDGAGDRDANGIPDWQEDARYADEVPLRRHRGAYSGSGLSWGGIALGLIFIAALVALIVYFIGR